MNYLLIGLAALLIIVVAGAFYCVVVLSAMRKQTYLPYEELERDFPNVDDK